MSPAKHIECYYPQTEKTWNSGELSPRSFKEPRATSEALQAVPALIKLSVYDSTQKRETDEKSYPWESFRIKKPGEQKKENKDRLTPY